MERFAQGGAHGGPKHHGHWYKEVQTNYEETKGHYHARVESGGAVGCLDVGAGQVYIFMRKGCS